MRWLFYGNLFIALAGLAQIFVTACLLEIVVAFEYYILIFFTVFFVYNLQRLSISPRAVLSARHRWIKENAVILTYFAGFSLCVSAVIFLLFFRSDWKIFFLVSFVTLNYFLGLRIRRFLFLKNICLALVWSLVTVAMPALFYGEKEEVIQPTLERFFLFLGISFLFDFRDRFSDKHHHVMTIATKWDYRGTLFFVFISATIGSITNHFSNSSFPEKLAVDFSFLALVVLTLGLRKSRDESYFLFGVDGLLFLQFFFVLLANLI